MAGTRKRTNVIVRRYDDARKEYPNMDEKTFLEFVAPGMDFKNPQTTMDNLRKGRTTGERIIERAKADSGRTITARYKVGETVDQKTGEVIEDIRGQNVRIPMSKSRLDLFRPGLLKRAVNTGLEKTYAMRAKDAGKQERGGIYEPIRELPEDAELLDLVRNARPRRPAQVFGR